MESRSGIELEDGQCILLSNCSLSSQTMGLYTAIASLRIVTSILSILGASSIVVSAIAKKQVTSQKVHPIFVLSIADLLLSIMWIVGGSIFLHGTGYKVVCFFLTLLTVILECVTINLTLVYALYANAHMRRTNINYSITNSLSSPDHGWPKLKVLVVYSIAWIIPIFLIMVPFFAVTISSDHNTISEANDCSCWCLPKFANVLPVSTHLSTTAVSRDYKSKVKKIGLTSSAVILAHYFVVFPLLVFFYVRVLRQIKRIKQGNNVSSGSYFYGATGTLLIRGHSRAKQRVVLFLSVFVISGLFNLVLAATLLIHLAVDFLKNQRYEYSGYERVEMPLLFIQSLTIPLQGFLNAIVYGWTREDFLYIMASTSTSSKLGRTINSANVAANSDLESSTLLTDSVTSTEYAVSPRTPLSQNF